MTIHQFFGKDFDRFFVGFDEQINRMAKLHDEMTRNIPNYPPYNIKKVDENKYVIEMAVAGFSKSEIEIEFAASLIKKDAVFKAKMQIEGENLNILKRGARLPI